MVLVVYASAVTLDRSSMFTVDRIVFMEAPCLVDDRDRRGLFGPNTFRMYP